MKKWKNFYKVVLPTRGRQGKGRLLPAIGVAVSAWLLVYFGRHLSIYHSFEAKTYDVRMQRLVAESPPRAGSDVVLVAIDEESIRFYRDEEDLPWPWPRSMYAHVLKFLEEAGARAIVFDITFTGDDPPWYKSKKTPPGEIFARSMDPALPCILPVLLRQKSGGSEIPFPPDLVIEVEHETARYRRAELPATRLAQSASMLGNVVISPDPDGIYRRIPPLFCYDDGHGVRWVPSLTTAAAIRAWNVKKVRWTRSGLWLDDRYFPTDRSGNILLRFPPRIAPRQFHPIYNIADLIQSRLQIEEGNEPQLSPQIFAGKYAIVLVISPDMYDLCPTPLDSVFPGGGVHAVLLDNLLCRNPMRQVTEEWDLLAVALVSLTTAFTVSLFLNLWIGTIATAMWAMVFYEINCRLFAGGIYLELLGPMTALAVAFVGTSLANYFLEGRMRGFLKNAFSHYVSRTVVDAIVDHPEKLRLGGERRTLSVFFSDIAGFTTISENRQPEELVLFLAEYLQEMTDIILRCDGTVDKFEGDAIMAFWGAPLDQEDHAVKACVAALENQKRLAFLREDFRRRGFPPLTARIGINSGVALAGNIGSSGRFNYTVIGDVVNLASRLEGANKIFKTGIMIGNTTYDMVRGKITARPLGKLQVKGKTIPEKVYEPLSLQTGSAPEQELIEDFARALSRYYRRDFAGAKREFADLLCRFPDDGPSRLYLDFCEEFTVSPPAPDWEGVIKLEVK